LLNPTKPAKAVPNSQTAAGTGMVLGEAAVPKVKFTMSTAVFEVVGYTERKASGTSDVNLHRKLTHHLHPKVTHLGEP